MFAFVVETANHKVAPSPKSLPPHSQIVLLDQPGYQSRGPTGTSSVALSGNAPLISAYGQNGFDEFCINFANEMLQSYFTRQTFDDTVGYSNHIVSDGVSIPAISTTDNTACVEMLRWQLPDKVQRKPGGLLSLMNKAPSAHKQGKGNSDQRNEDLSQEMQAKFGVHKARLWALSCIPPNDSGSPNSFDKRRVKAQIHSLLLSDLAPRRSVEYVADFDLA
ncbi:glycosyltransferase family 2 protein [Lentinula edodes]|uniref:Glycosyltransferase family 2 protein n=1 Tax=Lentinula edodes TaxID=5353 RepID=A0A1Q3EJP6_LENED|nr:glycosyltransferase family 2 protein [Lentinula edodes]